MATKGDVAKALAAMAAIHGRNLTEDAADMFLDDLADYAPDAVLNALRSCRKELRSFPSIADIVGRIEASDGRPGVEDAWAMIPQDEMGSVVWTDEMARAFSVANPLLKQGDAVGARMAFKEKYLQEVKTARESNTPVKWTPSFGYDPSLRQAAIQTAIDKKRLSHQEAVRHLPQVEHKTEAKALPPPPANPEETRERVRALIASITKPLPGGDA
jgi:hypothetical protein